MKLLYDSYMRYHDHTNNDANTNSNHGYIRSINTTNISSILLTTISPTYQSEFEAGLYIIIVILVYCIGVAFLACSGFKRKHNIRLRQDEDLQVFITNRPNVEKQARVDRVWKTDLALKRYYSHDETDESNAKSKEQFVVEIKNLIMKSTPKAFSFPPRKRMKSKFSRSCSSIF